MNWNAKFSDATTNTAFNLTLSRRMVQALRMVEAYSRSETEEAYSFDFSFSVPSMRSLENRGLAQHHPRPESYTKLSSIERRIFDKENPFWTLTPAGKLVYELCQMAGLIPMKVEKLEAA